MNKTLMVSAAIFLLTHCIGANSQEKIPSFSIETTRNDFMEIKEFVSRKDIVEKPLEHIKETGAAARWLCDYALHLVEAAKKEPQPSASNKSFSREVDYKEVIAQYESLIALYHEKTLSIFKKFEKAIENDDVKELSSLIEEHPYFINKDIGLLYAKTHNFCFVSLDLLTMSCSYYYSVKCTEYLITACGMDFNDIHKSIPATLHDIPAQRSSEIGRSAGNLLCSYPRALSRTLDSLKKDNQKNLLYYCLMTYPSIPVELRDEPDSVKQEVIKNCKKELRDWLDKDILSEQQMLQLLIETSTRVDNDFYSFFLKKALAAKPDELKACVEKSFNALRRQLHEEYRPLASKSKGNALVHAKRLVQLYHLGTAAGLNLRDKSINTEILLDSIRNHRGAGCIGDVYSGIFSELDFDLLDSFSSIHNIDFSQLVNTQGAPHLDLPHPQFAKQMFQDFFLKFKGKDYTSILDKKSFIAEIKKRRIDPSQFLVFALMGPEIHDHAIRYFAANVPRPLSKACNDLLMERLYFHHQTSAERIEQHNSLLKLYLDVGDLTQQPSFSTQYSLLENMNSFSGISKTGRLGSGIDKERIEHVVRQLQSVGWNFSATTDIVSDLPLFDNSWNRDSTVLDRFIIRAILNVDSNAAQRSLTVRTNHSLLDQASRFTGDKVEKKNGFIRLIKFIKLMESLGLKSNVKGLDDFESIVKEWDPK